MEIQYSKISSSGQTTIPIELRDKLGLKTGDMLGFIEEKGEIYLKPLQNQNLEHLKSLDKMFADWNDEGDCEYDNL